MKTEGIRIMFFLRINKLAVCSNILSTLPIVNYKNESCNIHINAAVSNQKQLSEKLKVNYWLKFPSISSFTIMQ
jgi:hypothetical protein